MPIWAICLASTVLLAAASLTARLWRSSAEVGSTPDRAFAIVIGILLLGFFGWISSAALSGGLADFPRFLLSVSAELPIVLACALIYLGTWRFYRPPSLWAALAAAYAAVAMLLAWLMLVEQGEPIATSGISPERTVLMLGRIGCLLWWGSESLLFYGKQQRGVALRRVQPAAAERIRFQGVGSISLAAALASATLCVFVLGRPPREVPAVLAVAIALGAVSAVAFYHGLYLRQSPAARD
jgi:hypothetical protein